MYSQLPLRADLHQDKLAILERMAKKANRLLGNFYDEPGRVLDECAL